MDVNTGELLNVDFGFMLSNSPGGIQFENSPFKLTKEMVDAMDGYHSDFFNIFRIFYYKACLQFVKLQIKSFYKYNLQIQTWSVFIITKKEQSKSLMKECDSD